ncbi:hypothetical protein NBRC116595_23480 [Aliiglaciecola sp. NS0011-25]
MKKYIFAIALSLISMVTKVNCNEKISFVNTFKFLKVNLQKIRQFELAIGKYSAVSLHRHG